MGCKKIVMNDWKKYIINYDLQDSLKRLSEKKIILDGFRPLPSIVLKSIKDALTHEWTYNSNSIEGNTITLQETKMIIEDGITVKGKSLREHFEVVNHQDAIEYIESLVSAQKKLTEYEVLETHALVLQKIEKEYAGRFRSSGVRITGANFLPPNALKVPQLMQELFDWVHQHFDSMHPVLLCTIFHHRFVHIHPFFDGNGRTVRLMFNMLLMQKGYPPAIILKVDRKKYYEALNKANNGDYNPLLLLMIQASERSINIYLNALSNNDDYQPINQIVSEPDSRYGQEYISLLARKGKIDAYKENGVWFTSKEAISNYLDNRKRKRA